jgi:RHS repeat-associated protein
VYDFEDTRALKTTRTGDAGPDVVRYIDRDVEERGGQMVRHFFFDAGRAVRIPGEPSTGARTGAALPAREGDSSHRPVPTAAAGVLSLFLGLCAALLARARRTCAASGRPPRAEPAGLALLPLLALLSATCGGASGAAQEGTAIDAWPEAATLELADHQASVVASVDAAGQVIAERAYHPYGLVRAARGAAAPHLYVGNERDHAVGLDDFRARGYHSAVARFLSVDPVALAPDDPGQAAQPAYAYTFGNPIDAADPDGRSCRGISCGIPPDATQEKRDALREAQFGDLQSAAIRTAAAISTLDELVSDTVSAVEWGLAAITALSPCACTKGLPEQAAERARDRRLAVEKRANARFERLGGGGGAARELPALPRSLGAAANITTTSRIGASSYATRLAERLSQSAQRDVDALLNQLRAGNMNPGRGTRALGDGFFELRGANAGRAIVKQTGAGSFDIVGKFQGHVRGDTANSAVIQRLMNDYLGL